MKVSHSFAKLSCHHVFEREPCFFSFFLAWLGFDPLWLTVIESPTAATTLMSPGLSLWTASNKRHSATSHWKRNSVSSITEPFSPEVGTVGDGLRSVQAIAVPRNCNSSTHSFKPPTATIVTPFYMSCCADLLDLPSLGFLSLSVPASFSWSSSKVVPAIPDQISEEYH